ncbi:leucine-rich repeat-containing protein 24 [Hermetia illucens]|uniref:leucine-rich repeat-containing protein 24 n=1 Tax=Hermetia illucens TaxID=343691 RepID=UPI0018CC1F08|nr:leucine-rich repeat-containing protein 24 [Hermetia illucens]
MKMEILFTGRLPALPIIYSTIIFQLICFIPVSDELEFTQLCGLCNCFWHTGKTANCENLSLTAIPRDLSPDLQFIHFSNNNIAEIRKNEFAEANLQNLQKLFLKNCTLMELNRDAFQGLNILIELDLSNNLLRELHPGTFAGVGKLRKLLVNNNELEYLQDGLFNELKEIRRIELKHNRISTIGPHTFSNLPSLKTIDLSFNNLTSLKVVSFQNIPNLVGISLEENPWNCTCHLLGFQRFAVENGYHSQTTACFNPKHLKGKLWNEVPPEQFTCRPEIIEPKKIGGDPFISIVNANNGNVTFTCRVRASQQPNIGWIYNTRSINNGDRRFRVFSSVEPTQSDDMNIYTSELTIKEVRPQDKGIYGCLAENTAGKDSAEIQLRISTNPLVYEGNEDSSSNLLLIICSVAIILLILLLAIILILCLYCRRVRFSKNATMSENGLIAPGFDKKLNNSMLEGSVITEVQKSLLTSVNPVEKPPRRTTDLESLDTEDGHETKKTLLDETAFGNHDEETNSISLSETTPRSRQTFVDDSHGANLPPDLLSFQAKMPQSPSMQSSMSNIPDNRFYGKSPLSSPVYQHVISQPPGNTNNSGIYGINPVAFRTLQHPKNKNVALLNNVRNNSSSPFVPAPIVYPPVIMKQGYMTIPRKPRVPSWTPSCNTTLSEFQPVNHLQDGPSALNDSLEPVYDNLGVRTSASGNSMLNLTKIGSSSHQPSTTRYTMKDRPLPATPNLNSSASGNTGTLSKIYEPIQEVNNSSITSDTDPFYGTAKSNGYGVKIVPSNTSGISTSGTMDRISKIPPRPPPKPKKRTLATSAVPGSTNQLFEDEGEDGTEV